MIKFRLSAMLRFLPAVACCLLCLTATPLAGEIKHFGVSDTTNFVSCAEKVLRKRVILDSNLPFKELSALCTDQTHDAFIALLNQHQVAVREDGNWAYIIHGSYFAPWTSDTPEADRLKWKHFQVDFSVHSADLQFHQNELALTPDQLSKINEQVLQEARLVPVFPPRTQSESEIAKLTFDLQVFVRHTKKDAAAWLVLLLREADDFSVAGRIICGQQQPDGSFKLAWDSPIVVARFPEVSFFDVNGDGAEEIIVKAAYPAGMRDLAAITIFDTQGQELTRQPRCSVPDLYGYSQEDGTCPIVAEAVDLDYSNGPPFNIDASNTLANGKDAVFKLVGSHYVRPSVPTMRKKAVAPK